MSSPNISDQISGVRLCSKFRCRYIEALALKPVFLIPNALCAPFNSLAEAASEKSRDADVAARRGEEEGPDATEGAHQQRPRVPALNLSDRPASATEANLRRRFLSATLLSVPRIDLGCRGGIEVGDTG